MGGEENIPGWGTGLCEDSEVQTPRLERTKRVGHCDLTVRGKRGKGWYCGSRRWVEELDFVPSSKRKPIKSFKQGVP